MLVDHAARIAFVHVPKVAGTATRHVLRATFPDAEAWIGWHEHATFGTLDHGHMTPATLARAYPDAYARTRDYAKFALIRDPVARFPSALAQRLLKFGPKPLELMTPTEIVDAARRAIETLTRFEREGCHVPYDWIHFERQVAYVGDPNWPVDAVAPVHRSSELVAAMAKHAGRPPPPRDARVHVENASMVYANDAVRTLAGVVRPLWHAVVPRRVRTPLARRLSRTLMVPRQSKYRRLFDTDEIVAFIHSYYAEDVIAWSSAEERWSDRVDRATS